MIWKIRHTGHGNACCYSTPGSWGKMSSSRQVWALSQVNRHPWTFYAEHLGKLGEARPDRKLLYPWITQGEQQGWLFKHLRNPSGEGTNPHMIVEDIKVCQFSVDFFPNNTRALLPPWNCFLHMPLSYSAVTAEFVSNSSFQTQNVVDVKLVSRVRSCSVTQRSFYTTANVK